MTMLRSFSVVELHWNDCQVQDCERRWTVISLCLHRAMVLHHELRSGDVTRPSKVSALIQD